MSTHRTRAHARSRQDTPTTPTNTEETEHVDTLQNYSNFLIHHRRTHLSSTALEDYFRTWLTALGVDEESWPHSANG